MNRQFTRDLRGARHELASAEAELEELSHQLEAFEAQVDARLGSLLDQMSELSSETRLLDDELRRIREEHLFGSDLMRYLDGAPKPARPISLTDLPPVGLVSRHGIPHPNENPAISSEPQVLDIKLLYRKLARRYHPDLARNDTDRAVSNEQMARINQAYDAGDLPSLMKLAGLSLPYGMNIKQPAKQFAFQPGQSNSELEQIEQKLSQVHQQIAQMSNLPIVKLSLEVKLASHQGRDLLGEMASDLRYKVMRKLAERDYLQSQIDANTQ